MKYFKAATLCIFFNLFIASSLFADDMPDYYNQQDTEEEHYAVPPPQYPSYDGAMIFFVNAAYTLWKPYQAEMILLNTNVTSNAKPASWIRPYTQLQSGFKVGAGVNTTHDGWKAQVEYTWFYNHPNMRSASLSEYITYYTIWSNTIDRQASAISSQFTNYFNRIDLTLDRTFYIGNYVSLCPWIGLLGAWEEQKFTIFTTPVVTPENIERTYQTMNWWALGPYGGFDSSYYCFDEWAIFFCGGGSINLATHYTSKYETRDNASNPVITNTKTKITRIEPMLETSIGIRWDTFGRDWGLRVQAGWELQYWFDHNTFIQGVGNAPANPYSFNGSYSMQGLTVLMRVNF
ncbi:MAG: hypothetical protein S4CHLAM20_13230 [Chlamydiia bacterium]|nr:hypothetical protein [Chlamydiia bacterium]